MGYYDEMCFGFLTFYPKQAVSRGATMCTAWKTIPFCQFELGNTIYTCVIKWTNISLISIFFKLRKREC